MSGHYVRVTLALILGLVAHPRAQRIRAPDAPPLEPSRLMTLLWDLYPELRDGRGLQTKLVKSPVGLQFEVTERDNRRGLVGNRDGEQLLEGVVQFDTQQELRSFSAKGPLLRYRDNLELADAMAAARRLGQNPDSEVSARGLPYGPWQRAALLLQEDWRAFEPRFGTVTIENAASRTDRRDAAYGFLWDVAVSTQKSTEPAAHWVLSFEPFEGRLVSMVRR
jgi:hypothetical protein